MVVAKPPRPLPISRRGLTEKIPSLESISGLTEQIPLLDSFVGRLLLRPTWVWRDGGITSRGKFCYFRTLLARVDNVLDAATAPSPRTLCVSGAQNYNRQ